MTKTALFSIVGLFVVACGSSTPPSSPPSSPSPTGAEVPRDSADCHFVTGDTCFKTAKDACAKAGCSEDQCLQAETHPVQISCKNKT